MNLVRYQNRKMYSPVEKRHVNYVDIINHMRLGGTIKVQCHKTRLDITDSVLRKCLEQKPNITQEEVYAFIRK